MSQMLLITFIDFGEMKSGSSVRPQRMYDAFKELGYNVTLLEGLQNRKFDRLKRVIRTYKNIKNNLPDFCYIEPPSGPFFNLCDHMLMLYLHRKKVPMGLFYRDAYWLYADFWQVKGIKKWALTQMHKFDLKIFKKTCKVIFFPSQTMADLFELKNKSTLPPAGMDLEVNAHENHRNALYIGGVSKFYGTDIMLKAFKILNEERNQNIKLTVCCREKEMKNFFDDYQNKSWLEVVHLSGDEKLKPLYNKCDIALYPSKRDDYMDFCMPVKLFEYLSRTIPIVSTNCKETAKFIETNEIGLVSKDIAEDFANVVEKLINDNELLKKLKNNSKTALLNKNLWIHRAKKAADEILH